MSNEHLSAFIQWRVENGAGDPMTESGDFISPQAKYEFQLWTDAWLSASNAVLAGRIAELTRENSEIKHRLAELNRLHSDLTNADSVYEGDCHTGYLITFDQLEEMEMLLSGEDLGEQI